MHLLYLQLSDFGSLRRWRSVHGRSLMNFALAQGPAKGLIAAVRLWQVGF